MHRPNQSVEIPNVVKRERTVGEVERCLGRSRRFRSAIAYSISGSLVSALARQSCSGKVQPENMGCSMLFRPPGEPAESAAEIDDALAIEVRKQRTDGRPFRAPSSP
jgi:hypothetical protein